MQNLASPVFYAILMFVVGLGIPVMAAGVFLVLSKPHQVQIQKVAVGRLSQNHGGEKGCSISKPDKSVSS